MKSSHVVDQLPLWVGGDLSEAEGAAVLAHLSQCPSCSAVAESLHTSQAWLKSASESPFSAEDHRQLRQRVMAQIQSEQKTRKQAWLPHFNPRWALLTAAALGFFMIGTRWFFKPPTVSSAPTTIVSPHLPQVAIQAPLPVPAQRTRIVRHRPAPESEIATTTDPTLSRIELQTSNPQIRIIWLARATAAATQPPPSPDRLVDPT